MSLLAEERLERIIVEAKRHRVIKITDLRDVLGVTARTIRRDLEELERRGILKRTHGGAVWVGDPAHDLTFAVRASTCREEKARIGAVVSNMVKPGEAIIIDAGSTMVEVARNIPDLAGLTVTTNSLSVAAELVGKRSVTTIMSGGVLRETTLSLVGHKAEETFKQINADKAFIGASGITIEHGFTNSNPFEAEVKRAMIQAAREVIVVADHTKLGKVNLASFAALADVDLLITGVEADEITVKYLQNNGLKVMLA
ncbi:MAG: DeoR/GlpR transcriptional regulator [Firmicutes bacterium]|nr:DeoR/GlpR transcriptional regulator [Bacillota bacterium]